MSSNNGGSRSSDEMKVIVVVSDTSNMNPHTDNSLVSEQSTIGETLLEHGGQELRLAPRRHPCADEQRRRSVAQQNLRGGLPSDGGLLLQWNINNQGV